MRPFVPSPPPRFALAFWLALLLLAAQALGLAHRVVHAPGLHGDVALFAGHDAGGGECRLIDQIGGDLALPIAAATLPPAAPQPQPQAVPRPAACRAAAAPYEARAPPRG